jgi:FkbM family methyltransferase
VSKFVKGLRGELFVDIGANTGYYAKLLEDSFTRVMAVEADPEICEYLRQHCPQNCVVLCAAVADRIGYTELHRNPEDAWGLYTGARIGADYYWKGMRVQTVPLSNILEGKSNVDLVKVDVEGAEWLVLRGAEPVMAKIRRWIIELHDLTRKAELVSYMRQYGYTCEWIDEYHAYFSRS